MNYCESGTDIRDIAQLDGASRALHLAIDEVLGSRLVCEPLHLFMLCSPNEGAAAVVLKKAEGGSGRVLLSAAAIPIAYPSSAPTSPTAPSGTPAWSRPRTAGTRTTCSGTTRTCRLPSGDPLGPQHERVPRGRRAPRRRATRFAARSTGRMSRTATPNPQRRAGVVGAAAHGQQHMAGADLA